MEKVKIYFEDGQLRIRVPEEKTEERRRFFYDIFPIDKEWVTKDRVMYIVNESSWALVIRIAKQERHKAFIELSQDVEDYYLYQLQLARERAEREAVEEKRREDIKRGDSVQKNGCGWCMHLAYENAHWQEVNGEKVWVHGTHYCKYAMDVCRYKADEIEYEFECNKDHRYYNPPPGYNPPAFVAKPYPCAWCEYLEKANKAWEEINKEKEGNG